MTTVRVAAVQATPVFLDRDATVAKACPLIEQAGSQGAQLVVFPEAFIPTYPDWVWRSRPWDDGPAAWFSRLYDNAVIVGGPATTALGDAAREAGCVVVRGINEREAGNSMSTRSPPTSECSTLPATTPAPPWCASSSTGAPSRPPPSSTTPISLPWPPPMRTRLNRP